MRYITLQQLAKIILQASDNEDGCWIWPVLNRHGYGTKCLKVDGKRKNFQVHRLVFAEFFPEVDIEGKHLHHTCNNKPCINPTHLLPLTPAEHNLQTAKENPRFQRAVDVCVNGHTYTEANTRLSLVKTGLHSFKRKKTCRACDRERKRRRALNQAVSAC